MKGNLVVTYDPSHAGKAKEEAEEMLKDSGGGEFEESRFDGVFVIQTKEDAKKIVRDLQELCRNEPYKFKYTFKWVPIEKWCRTDEKDIENEMDEINGRMDPEESWKMDMGKRGFEGDTVELIKKFTDHIDKPKVDLKNPQKIVKVEIIGDRTGISLLDKDEYLNVAKLKVA